LTGVFEVTGVDQTFGDQPVIVDQMHNLIRGATYSQEFVVSAVESFAVVPVAAPFEAAISVNAVIVEGFLALEPRLDVFRQTIGDGFDLAFA
jgi:hypothetical protein